MIYRHSAYIVILSWPNCDDISGDYCTSEFNFEIVTSFESQFRNYYFRYSYLILPVSEIITTYEINLRNYYQILQLNLILLEIIPRFHLIIQSRLMSYTWPTCTGTYIHVHKNRYEWKLYKKNVLFCFATLNIRNQNGNVISYI